MEEAIAESEVILKAILLEKLQDPHLAYANINDHVTTGMPLANFKVLGFLSEVQNFSDWVSILDGGVIGDGCTGAFNEFTTGDTILIFADYLSTSSPYDPVLLITHRCNNNQNFKNLSSFQNSLLSKLNWKEPDLITPWYKSRSTSSPKGRAPNFLIWILLFISLSANGFLLFKARK
ncbi:MAG: hypothetical protein GYB31_15255 [Bacteroidetes bacterium]|nr:hypothetical protein [Bacteroidota bacterium]